MPELILGLVVAFMGLAWWFQQPLSTSSSRVTSTIVQERSLGQTNKEEDTGRSQIILVNSVEESSPFACRPLEKEKEEPIIRNLTEPFEQRSYLVEPGEQCILE